jgi:methyl-accepting chemotaxis protein
MRQWHADQAQIKADAAEVQQARAGWAFIGMLLCFGVPATWFSFNVLGRLKQGFAEADAMAAAIAAGDLGVKVHSGGQDEIGHLLSSMERMNGHLVAVISQVRQAADSIGTASSEVAAGNVDLSHRTETTASNLQQTASSTEQLGATVRQNAGHAKQASELANGASGVATHGGEVVSQVVATMREINESSKQIAEITGVIDGIAFQTNILALNAAVEAARAGEQGRGFAVVAAEVRSLAQRSAEAARQIKTLIQASVERVEAGSRQADDAGHTMAEVVEAIKRVSEIVAEISQASREQSEGVALVGQAVSQMDQATQQNAALVEQSAAAAESLSAQAQQLVQAVAAFKLASTTDDHPSRTVGSRPLDNPARRSAVPRRRAGCMGASGAAKPVVWSRVRRSASAAPLRCTWPRTAGRWRCTTANRPLLPRRPWPISRLPVVRRRLLRPI